MKSMFNKFNVRRQSATQTPVASSAFCELTAEETSQVAGGLGPFAYFVVMAVCRFGFANASH